MSTRTPLPLTALKPFAAELERTFAKSVEAAATFDTIVAAAARPDTNMHMFAELVILKHQRMIESVEAQVAYWSSLTLTPEEQIAIDRCKHLIDNLTQLQQFFEAEFPVSSARIH